MNMSALGALHLTKHTGAKHSATVIFFHGSGSSGCDMKEWVNIMVSNFSFPHIKIMYPTAPLQPYTPAGGQMSNVWFDRAGVSPSVPEKLESIAKIEVEVKNLIKKENDAGIPSSRIILGGFSMGGSLSFYTGFRSDQNLAGVFVFSSFLNNNSVVYQEVKDANRKQYICIELFFFSVPPLLQLHGDADDLVDMKWGQYTFEQLKALGIQGEFRVQSKLGHSINRRGMITIKEWIEKLLPEL
ncbi:Lysophospholipase-like protein 1 [Operophtera brumata]|uniref:palmitoyl-protein hydrolase n=1 Tax=Operophtera brumata TaxID=104452 RepID=A0A0L7KV72_OPEBR|nr:Lysophospholipase-like protein 1 [Operophtera brumata]